jgi:tRNA C32,U32 (ribose-2'-O)-methylase TrmJ
VQGPGQSLNVSVAAAVLLYEARRQRDAKALTLPATAETKPAAGRNRRGGEAGERQ